MGAFPWTVAEARAAAKVCRPVVATAAALHVAARVPAPIPHLWGPEPGGSGPSFVPLGQELVQVTLPGGVAPSPVAVNPNVVEAFEPNVPL